MAKKTDNQWHSDDSCPKCLGNPCECSRKETQS